MGTVINVCRVVSFLPIVVFFIDFLYKVNWQSVSVPHDAEIYKWLHQENTYERSHIRCWVIEMLYVPPLLLATGAFYLFPNEPQWLFIGLFFLAGISMLATIQTPKLNN